MERNRLDNVLKGFNAYVKIQLLHQIEQDIDRQLDAYEGDLEDTIHLDMICTEPVELPSYSDFEVVKDNWYVEARKPISEEVKSIFTQVSYYYEANRYPFNNEEEYKQLCKQISIPDYVLKEAVESLANRYRDSMILVPKHTWFSKDKLKWKNNGLNIMTPIYATPPYPSYPSLVTIREEEQDNE